MSEKLTDHGPFLNTDRELQISINVGGMVFVKSLRQWHEAAKDHAAAEERGRRSVFADPEALARRFHETYERLAPEHGYETRKESAVPWEKVPEKNRRLMIAVCAALAPRDGDETERDELRTMLQNAAPHIIAAGHFRLWACKCGYCAPLQAALAPRDSAPVCDNCKRAAKAKDGRSDRGIEIGPCYCDTLRAPRDSGKEG